MSNHIHLLLEPLNNALAVGVHRFAMRYAQQFNQRHNKRGYVFQGRFRSILIEDGLYIRRLSRYIHLNPLESGLVARPEDYWWSSYNAYFGRATFAWLEIDRVLSYFGTTRMIATDNFAEFTVAKSDASEDLKQIVRASRVGVYGSEEFTQSFVEVIHSKESTDDKKCSIEPLMKALCDRFGVTTERLLSSEKTRSVVEARATFARAAQLLQQYTLGDVCNALGKHHGTISRLASKCMKCPKLQAIADEVVLTLL